VLLLLLTIMLMIMLLLMLLLMLLPLLLLMLLGNDDDSGSCPGNIWRRQGETKNAEFFPFSRFVSNIFPVIFFSPLLHISGLEWVAIPGSVRHPSLWLSQSQRASGDIYRVQENSPSNFTLSMTEKLRDKVPLKLARHPDPGPSERWREICALFRCCGLQRGCPMLPCSSSSSSESASPGARRSIHLISTAEQKSQHCSFPLSRREGREGEKR